MKRSLLVLTLLAVAACGSDGSSASPSSAESAAAGTTAAAPKAVPAAVREVRCGCKIDGIKKCGNYVAVDGQWLEITNPAEHGLGTMEWCRATEKVEATVAGEKVAGGIHVSTLTVQ